MRELDCAYHLTQTNEAICVQPSRDRSRDLHGLSYREQHGRCRAMVGVGQQWLDIVHTIDVHGSEAGAQSAPREMSHRSGYLE